MGKPRLSSGSSRLRRFGLTAVSLGLVAGGLVAAGPVASALDRSQPLPQATRAQTSQARASRTQLTQRLQAGRSDGPGSCPPLAAAYHYSDALDKVSRDGATVGGLSNVAYDARLGSFVSSVDNHESDPSRLWFYRDIDQPRIWRDPLVLKKPDGTPYTGMTADNEGLAVLPDGRFLVSSETEPSIRIFGRDGVQQSELNVPSRFRVSPAGQASANATLEGLTITPDGKTVVASMEGTLSGDTSADGSAASYRRFLVYTQQHGTFRLTKQLGYRTDDGLRVPEIQAYTNEKLLVMEASYDPAAGNVIKLYAVTDGAQAPDVSSVANLSANPGAITEKKLIADVTACPTLGATAKQPQTNPLLDNYEGMITKPIAGHVYQIALISDDNFNATEVSRTLDLVALLP